MFHTRVSPSKSIEKSIEKWKKKVKKEEKCRNSLLILTFENLLFSIDFFRLWNQYFLLISDPQKSMKFPLLIVINRRCSGYLVKTILQWKTRIFSSRLFPIVLRELVCLGRACNIPQSILHRCLWLGSGAKMVRDLRFYSRMFPQFPRCAIVDRTNKYRICIFQTWCTFKNGSVGSSALGTILFLPTSPSFEKC